LSEKNVKLREAIKPPAISVKYSPYYNNVREGATIVPRSFWFVDFDMHPTLGIDLNRPLVKSAEDALREAKVPWRNIELKGNIEADFIYATLLGEDIVPFGYRKLRPVVLPLELSSTSCRLLDVDALRNRGFILMAEWLEKAQRLWSENATKRSLKDYPRIISWLDCMGRLSSQNPKSKYFVLYNTSGTNLVSYVVNKWSLSAFQILKAKISPKGFIAESTTYFYETDDEVEAHYLCAFLNSNVINDAVKPLQSGGLFGERHFSRKAIYAPHTQI